jgi:hypothetical protein
MLSNTGKGSQNSTPEEIKSRLSSIGSVRSLPFSLELFVFSSPDQMREY